MFYWLVLRQRLTQLKLFLFILFCFRENLQSETGRKHVFYATNNILPRHIFIKFTINSSTHKQNSERLNLTTPPVSQSNHQTSTQPLEPPHTSAKSWRRRTGAQGALIKLLWSQMLRSKVKISPIHGGFAL